MQFILGFIGVCILFGIFIAACTGGNNQPSSNHMQENHKQPETKESAKPVDTSITKEKYDQIVQGDALTGVGGSTVASVINLMGEPSNESTSETAIDGKTYKMDVYTWMTNDFEMVAVTFTNGFVSNKSWSK